MKGCIARRIVIGDGMIHFAARHYRRLNDPFLTPLLKTAAMSKLHSTLLKQHSSAFWWSRQRPKLPVSVGESRPHLTRFWAHQNPPDGISVSAAILQADEHDQQTHRQTTLLHCR